MGGLQENLLVGGFRLLRGLGGFGGRGGRRRCLFTRGVLGRPLVLRAVRLGTGVKVRVPAAALEREGGLADQLVDLLRLALRAGLDVLVRHLLPLLELVAAGGAGVFVDRHAPGA